MNERERRIGLNEALFREVNERLRGVNEAFSTLTNRAEIVCECARIDCAERLSLSIQEYEDLRSAPDRFAVAPGHEDPSDVEWVVESHAGWDLVRKRPGGPAELAAETDPRDGP